jgi:lipopolysaccharide biosynthesis protein
MDPTLMLIGSVYQLFVDNGGANKSKLVQLLNRIGLDNSNMLFPFVAGTMAIYRGAVLNRLFEVVTPTDLDEGRPDDLTYNVDGQFAHALERALGILGHKLGRVVWR